MSAASPTRSVQPVLRGFSSRHSAQRRPRTFQPLHRNSRHASENREIDLWRRYNTFSRAENNARMRAAEQFDRDTKRPGKRNGALGHVGLDVLRLMLRLRGKRGGRLDPSLQWIADELHRARSAVAAAIARLKAHGFLDWVRRSRPVDDPARPDQYVEQISNAYFFTMPERAAEFVRRMVRRPTEAQRNKAECDALEARWAALGLDGVLAAVGAPELRDLLATLAVGVDSANPPGGLKGHCAADNEEWDR